MIKLTQCKVIQECIKFSGASILHPKCNLQMFFWMFSQQSPVYRFTSSRAIIKLYKFTVTINKSGLVTRRNSGLSLRENFSFNCFDSWILKATYVELYHHRRPKYLAVSRVLLVQLHLLSWMMFSEFLHVLSCMQDLLHCLPVDYRITFKVFIMVWGSVTGAALEEIRELSVWSQLSRQSLRNWQPVWICSSHASTWHQNPCSLLDVIVYLWVPKTLGHPLAASHQVQISQSFLDLGISAICNACPILW